MAKGTKMADEMAGKMKAASAALKGERGIFRRLASEHAEINTMMMRLARSGDYEMRRQIFDELRKQLLTHAKGEEREFYPVFRQFEETSEMVEEALDDHASIEEILEQLRTTELDSEEWEELFEELRIDLQDHIQQEENELFPLAERLIDDDDATKLEERYLHSREQLLRRVA